MPRGVFIFGVLLSLARATRPAACSLAAAAGIFGRGEFFGGVAFKSVLASNFGVG